MNREPLVSWDASLQTRASWGATLGSSLHPCARCAVWRSRALPLSAASPGGDPAAVMPRTFSHPGVFTECCRKDEERAQKLLVRVSGAWGKTTCLQLALEAKDMKFMSHGGIR